MAIRCSRCSAWPRTSPSWCAISGSPLSEAGNTRCSTPTRSPAASSPPCPTRQASPTLPGSPNIRPMWRAGCRDIPIFRSAIPIRTAGTASRRACSALARCCALSMPTSFSTTPTQPRAAAPICAPSRSSARRCSPGSSRSGCCGSASASRLLRNPRRPRPPGPHQTRSRVSKRRHPHR